MISANYPRGTILYCLLHWRDNPYQIWQTLWGTSADMQRVARYIRLQGGTIIGHKRAIN